MVMVLVGFVVFSMLPFIFFIQALGTMRFNSSTSILTKAGNIFFLVAGFARLSRHNVILRRPVFILNFGPYGLKDIKSSMSAR